MPNHIASLYSISQELLNICLRLCIGLIENIILMTVEIGRMDIQG